MSDCLIKIGDIEKFSIVDFPGKIAVVVFMQGCPWRCPFCYNQSLQDANTASGDKWDELLSLLERRKGITDAVVFSGGEPLMQDGLEHAVEAVRAKGFETGLHTGGYRPELLAKIVNKLSWTGLDIKAPLEAERYKKATGGFGVADKVKDSLNILVRSGMHFECRTTCDPRILSIEDIRKISDALAAAGVKEYYLQKYRPVETDKTTSDDDCERFFRDKELLAELKAKFQIFDIRK